jgi:hypothetical protein
VAKCIRCDKEHKNNLSEDYCLPCLLEIEEEEDLKEKEDFEKFSKNKKTWK